MPIERRPGSITAVASARPGRRAREAEQAGDALGGVRLGHGGGVRQHPDQQVPVAVNRRPATCHVGEVDSVVAGLGVVARGTRQQTGELVRFRPTQLGPPFVLDHREVELDGAPSARSLLVSRRNTWLAVSLRPTTYRRHRHCPSRAANCAAAGNPRCARRRGSPSSCPTHDSSAPHPSPRASSVGTISRCSIRDLVGSLGWAGRSAVGSDPAGAATCC